MNYLDTSSLLKLFLVEPESAAVGEAIREIDSAFVSQITELETAVQLRALNRGGTISGNYLAKITGEISNLLATPPFFTRKLKGSVFETAIRQHRPSPIHCRSLDRLHLAAMEEFGITRLMTHDTRQAEAARDLGYEVVSPGS